MKNYGSWLKPLLVWVICIETNYSTAIYVLAIFSWRLQTMCTSVTLRPTNHCLLMRTSWVNFAYSFYRRSPTAVWRRSNLDLKMNYYKIWVGALTLNLKIWGKIYSPKCRLWICFLSGVSSLKLIWMADIYLPMRKSFNIEKINLTQLIGYEK